MSVYARAWLCLVVEYLLLVRVGAAGVDEVVVMTDGRVSVAQHRVHIVHAGDRLEERQQIEQLSVGHVVEPRRHRNLHRQHKRQPTVLNVNTHI